MAKPSTRISVTHKAKTDDHEPNLKGTLVAVMLLGVTLIVVWGIAFTLYMSRL